MSNPKPKRFIEILDEYKIKKEFQYSDYVTILSLINKSYNENNDTDLFLKQFNNYYSENSTSLWNTSTHNDMS